MKYVIFSIVLLISACAAHVPATDSNAAQTAGSVIIFLKNNSLLPRKFTIIGYTPGERGNWTTGFALLPGASKKFKMKIGTKVYNATNDQVGVVMGGGSIRSDEPLVLVTSEDNGKTFDLKE